MDNKSNPKDSPMGRGFGKRTGRVKDYAPYNQGYEDYRQSKGADRRLVRSGKMRDQTIGKGTVRATRKGFSLTAGAVAGKFNYALSHQFGATITVTEKMIRFFWAKAIESGHQFWRNMARMKVGQEIKIPERKFWALDSTDIRGLASHIQKKLLSVINAKTGVGKSVVVRTQ